MRELSELSDRGVSVLLIATKNAKSHKSESGGGVFEQKVTKRTKRECRGKCDVKRVTCDMDVERETCDATKIPEINPITSPGLVTL